MIAEARPSGSMLSAKLRDYHLARLAIVYVRQSSPQQVLDHRESTARQYALVDRAVALGWPADRVVVIDEDQGQSGQSATARLGFQRLLAEVSLDHVGLVLGLEMSRFARSCKDWHQLLELCGVFRTLLADADGLYDPTDYNDRLLLGLKGTMSEAELHILKGRMLEGKRNKARRGELLSHPPIGYVRGPGGDYQMDPDEQAQGVVRLIFDVFEREGSLHGLLRWLRAHDVRLPIRPHFGPDRGQLQWRRPHRTTLHNLLHHPIYAGAYRWGYRSTDPRRQKPGRRSSGRTLRKLEECEVLLQGRFPAYISWERFEAIQKRLANNRAAAEAMGAPREGPALLGGLLVCGRCNHRLTVTYSGKARRLRYSCGCAMIDYGEPLCQGLSGQFLDAFVTEQVMNVLQPASLELSLAAEAELRGQRQQLEKHWQQRLERAAFEADRAARQYAAVEPENRLVARELERRWEEALEQKRHVEEDFDRFRRQRPEELSPAQRGAVLRLSEDMPRIWHAVTTTVQDRQEIVRLLLDRVVVNVEGESDQVDVTLHWAGGLTSHHRLIRPIACYRQLSNYRGLCERIAALRKQGVSPAEIAACLNREGFHPPKRATCFKGSMVTRLLGERGLRGPRPRAMTDPKLLEEHEYWLTDLARRLGIPVATMHKWQRVGWVHSRKVAVSGGRWAIWADDDEFVRLKQLRAFRRKWPEPRYPAELTNPKSRAKIK
jgi:DNA invertase Pin-like site-specific DNA recombinase